MSAFCGNVGRVILAAAVVGVAAECSLGEVVTWKDSVTTGTWHIDSNWDTGAQPAAGDDAVINSGNITYWGAPTNNGSSFNVRGDSSVTVNGGTIGFGGSYGLNVGAGGSGTASALVVNGGAFNPSGTINIGNAAGEAGTLTIGPAASFDAGSGSSNLFLQATGVINSAGTVSDVGYLFLTGGVLNITGGSFTVNQRIDFESNSATGAKVNIADGTLTANNSQANLDLNLGYGNRYFNFLSGSTGTLVLPNISTAVLEGYLTSGYVRLDGLASADSFVVTPFGGSGAQVSLVPEPGTATLLCAGLGLLARRRRARLG